MFINLVVGDWSDDGHGKVHVIPVESNKEVDDVMYAFDKGNEGVNLEQYCSDYEDNMVPTKLIMEFVSEDLYLCDPDEEFHDIESATYAEIWLGIARKGDPELVISVTEEELPEIRIGGYGLFW